MKRHLYRASRWALALIAIPVLSGCFTLDYSPDGSRVLLSWGNNDDLSLAVANVDGTHFRLVPGSENSAFGHWSPDGAKLSFVNERGLMAFDMTSGKVTKLRSGSYGDTGWIDSMRLVASKSLHDGANGPPNARFEWIDLANPAGGQTIDFASDLREVRSIRPIPRTEGAVFLDGRQLFVAEFGAVRSLTTTNDVVGYAMAADGNRVVYARETKSTAQSLLTIFEIDLRARTGRRLATLPGLPRVGSAPPESASHAEFSNDFSTVMVWLKRNGKDAQPASNFERLAVASVAGGAPRIALTLPSGSQGLVATFAPDGQSAMALIGDEKALRWESVSIAKGVSRLLRMSKQK